jgi:hypothetical protein
MGLGVLASGILDGVLGVDGEVEFDATSGDALARAHIYELVFNTVVKVSSRVRQIVSAPPTA